MHELSRPTPPSQARCAAQFSTGEGARRESGVQRPAWCAPWPTSVGIVATVLGEDLDLLAEGGEASGGGVGMHKITS